MTTQSDEPMNGAGGVALGMVIIITILSFLASMFFFQTILFSILKLISGIMMHRGRFSGFIFAVIIICIVANFHLLPFIFSFVTQIHYILTIILTVFLLLDIGLLFYMLYVLAVSLKSFSKRYRKSEKSPPDRVPLDA